MEKDNILTIKVLSLKEISDIHKTSVKMLNEIGIKIQHKDVLKKMSQTRGASVNFQTGVVNISEELVESSIGTTTKKHSIYGRDKTKKVTFGGGDIVFKSSDGDAMWIDLKKKERRKGNLQDVRESIIIADALPHISLVGPMVIPSEIPAEVVDIHLFIELLTHTNKPITCWLYSKTSARYVLEILEMVAGGRQELKKTPLIQTCIEPISPLQIGKNVLDIFMLFAERGLPVRIAPMALGMSSAPVTLAGLIAQENAEILAGIVVSQILCPGMPVLYDAAHHVMDPHSAIASYGAPEQGLMAVASTQVAKSYGLPVYVDVGYSDSKIPDFQSGMEKGITLLMGVLAGADTFGHMGICGPSQGASVEQLIIDNEMIGYIKRIVQKFDVNEETLAFTERKKVGIGGSFLMEDHTINHFKKELWFPAIFDREGWHKWSQDGRRELLDKAIEMKKQILDNHHTQPIDNKIQKEMNKILKAARKELLK